MPSRNPVEQLLAHYPLEDAALIFRILYPLLSDQGRAYLPALEAKVASRPANARLSTSTWSSGRSGRSLASPLYDRSGSQMGFSDASSIAESAHSGFALDTDSLSTTTSLTAGSAGSRKGQRPGGRIAKSRTSVVSAASSPVISPRKPSFECPFCWELKIPTSISRKADLKRHFKQFHQNNAQWICQERGCSMAYDWKSAFEAHLKEAHGNTQHPSDSHQVKLCPQVVFACGFSNCRLIFEATSDDDAEKKAQEYFNHVANHFDDNLTHRNWSHSVRIRNLMRQTAVETHWKDRKKGPADPVWQPHTSSVVRKILETRHFTDIALLVQWVVNLGSFAFSQPHSPIPKLPAELRLPVKDNCTLTIAGHLPLVRRESHRHHMDFAVDHPMPTTKSEPNPSPEPVKTEDPDPPPEPEPELAEPDYHHHPPTTTTATHHENSLSMLGFDHQPEPASFFTDHLPHHHHPFDTTPNTNTIPATTAAGSTDTFLPDSSNNNNPISHWLGMTEPPPLQGHGMPLQPHLDAILGYSTGGFAGHDPQQQQQMVGGLGGFHHDGMGQQQQQQQQGMGGMGIAGLHQHHGLPPGGGWGRWRWGIWRWEIVLIKGGTLLGGVYYYLLVSGSGELCCVDTQGGGLGTVSGREWGAGPEMARETVFYIPKGEDGWIEEAFSLYMGRKDGELERFGDLVFGVWGLGVEVGTARDHTSYDVDTWLRLRYTHVHLLRDVKHSGQTACKAGRHINRCLYLFLLSDPARLG